MKYLLLGDEHETLFIEDDEQHYSIKYDPQTKKWLPGGSELFDNRIGFDSSEPIDSPYRYGNSSCMRPIIKITKEKAEEFISKEINENALNELLKHIQYQYGRI